MTGVSVLAGQLFRFDKRNVFEVTNIVYSRWGFLQNPIGLAPNLYSSTLVHLTVYLANVLV